MSEALLSPRVLAIDPGEKRIGLAVSDPFGNFAVGLETVQVAPNQSPLPAIQALCERYEVQTVVMGLPLHLSGAEGEAAHKARALAEALRTTLGLPVELMDERLTSKIAEQALRAQGVRSAKSRKQGFVDQAAAILILQAYLDRRARR